MPSAAFLNNCSKLLPYIYNKCDPKECKDGICEAVSVSSKK